MTAGERRLAVLGGTPAFSEPVVVGRPNIGDRARFIARMNDMLDRRWLSNHGRYEEELAEALRDHTGARHCIPVDNCTRGLEIAMAALGMDGEVIVPAFTFPATPHAVSWRGATPVFADISPATHTIDPAHAASLVTPRTTGIVGVHLWGQPCDTEGLAQVAQRHGLKLVYDAAHAFGCSHQGRPIAAFGDATVFSFHATKFVNSFEGGSIATDDDELADRMWRMTTFGLALGGREAIVGINGKMSEPAAAMGLTSLESIDRFLAANRRNFAAYAEHLAAIEGVSLFVPGGESPNLQYVVLMVDGAEASLDSDTLQAALWAENVQARRYFYPACHRLAPYASRGEPPDLPVTDRTAASVLCLPTGTQISGEDVARICDLIRCALARAPEIRAALRSNGR